MAAAVRWLSLLLCLAASSPLIGQFAARWPKEIVIFGKQSELLAIAEKASLTIIQHPWFYWILFGLVSFATGIWSEWLAQRFDHSHRRKSLGRSLLSLARWIDSAHHNHELKWPWSIQHVRVDLQSALLKTSRLDIWVPDHTIFLRRDANLLISYLTRDRHVIDRRPPCRGERRVVSLQGPAQGRTRANAGNGFGSG